MINKYNSQYLQKHSSVMAVLFLLLLFLVPLLFNFTDEMINPGELYSNYLSFSESNIVPPFLHIKRDILPVTYIFLYQIKALFNLNSFESLFLLRSICIFFSGVYFYLIAEFIAKKVFTDHRKRSLFTILSLFLLLSDWNFSYLLGQDQLRNLVGNLFFFSTIYYFLSKDYKFFIFCLIICCLSHKQYWLFFILVFALGYITSKFEKHFLKLTVAITLSSVPICLTFKELVKNIPFLSYGDRFSHDILLGFQNAFLHRPGVLLATFAYICVFSLLLINYKKLIKHRELSICFIISLTLFLVSKVGILGIKFVEPNRLYYTLNPFLILSATYVLLECYGKKIIITTIPLLYLILNLLFLSFGSEFSLQNISIYFVNLITHIKIVFNPLLLSSILLFLIGKNINHLKATLSLSILLCILGWYLQYNIFLFLALFIVFNQFKLIAFYKLTLVNILVIGFLFFFYNMQNIDPLNNKLVVSSSINEKYTFLATNSLFLSTLILQVYYLINSYIRLEISNSYNQSNNTVNDF